MSNQAAKMAEPESSDEDSTTETALEHSEWTQELERVLLFHMIRLKPCGSNKHLSMLFIRDKISEELKVNIPSRFIWKFLESKWNIGAADVIESASFDTSEKNFSLPDEFDQLILEEEEKIRKSLVKERLNDELNKKKSFSGAGVTRSKSNSMSSVDSKDGLNENVPISENSFTKTNEIVSEEAPSTRRSLRTNDKLEEKVTEDDQIINKKKMLRINNKPDEPWSKDFKQLIKKIPGQSKDLEKNEKVAGVRGRKRKTRNISESSFSSDNSKQTRSFKNNLTDLTVSDSSSRSVTPEILRGKTSNRSVTPETSRKSNLRSSDKDHKSKLALEKACLRFGHNVDLILPEIKIERFKPEKQVASSPEQKSKHSLQNKNDASPKMKGKTRGRVTSDLLVVQQSPDVQSLGRRSCSTSGTKNP